MSTALDTHRIAAKTERQQSAKKVVQILLDSAGIRIDGDQPFDVRVKNEAFYDVAVPAGLTAIREAYVNGWWDTDRLDELTYKVVRHGVKLSYGDALTLTLATLSARLRNKQTPRRSLEVRQHYDLGNDLFQAMLDRYMVYSCAYWENASTLDEAQQAKMDMICRKVGLRPGMRVLDIGCGWGGFARFAAERYGVSVVGVTISEEQVRLGQSLCTGLPIELRLEDYRHLSRRAETFDAVVSVGMFEHVGYKNYRNYMKIVRQLLKPEGLFLLQTIGLNKSDVGFDPWLNKYIFPNALIPSVKQIATACEGIMLVEDWHSFGINYDRTLMAWFHNFDSHWPLLQDKYGERFYRIWKCYLLTCAGLFRARQVQLWQMVFSPNGRVGGYISIR